MTRIRSRARGALARGFTLIEVMIAMLIGLIGVVVIMQTFAVSEGFKRTATSGTDAQMNGGIALYMLQREMRMAGYGMNSLVAMGCPSVRVYRSTTSTGIDMPLVPFMLNPPLVPAGDANTDTMLIAYGTSDSFVSGITLVSSQASATAPFYLVSNYDAFQNGDLFVSVMPGAGAGGSASCVLHEATATWSAAGNCGHPPTSGVLGMLEHNQVSYQKHTSTGCVTVASTFNNGTGITTAGGAVEPNCNYPTCQVYGLGDTVVHVYAIRGGNLTMCDWIAADCGNAANFNIVVNDIVSLRGMYGMNLNPAPSALPGDGQTITWQRSSLTTDVFLPSRVLAATIEITARNSLKEKPTSGTTCNATLFSGRPDRSMDWLYQATAGAAIDISTSSADWQCYRYRLFQTSVPLRNLIWRPS
jgi:type IV pilus assembly protein PilW